MKHSNPSTLHSPMGYSHVVEVVARRTLYVSGQIALDAQGRLVGPDDLRRQTTQVFENLRAALEASGAGLRDVAKLTVFLTDVSRIAEFREARDRFFAAPLPACSLVEVAKLARPDLMIEVEAVAAIEDGLPPSPSQAIAG